MGSSINGCLSIYSKVSLTNNIREVLLSTHTFVSCDSLVVGLKNKHGIVIFSDSQNLLLIYL